MGDVMAETKDTKKAAFKVLTGLNYPGLDGATVRREPDDIADDIPASSVGWLLADGHIEKA